MPRSCGFPATRNSVRIWLLVAAVSSALPTPGFPAANTCAAARLSWVLVSDEGRCSQMRQRGAWSDESCQCIFIHLLVTLPSQESQHPLQSEEARNFLPDDNGKSSWGFFSTRTEHFANAGNTLLKFILTWVTALLVHKKVFSGFYQETPFCTTLSDIAKV